MSKRIDVIASLIEPCGIFADVGCDHGLVAKKVLDEELAEKVFITDISKPSLDKAIALLEEFYPDKFTAYLTDGLTSVPAANEVLIAGMGGEEIIKIIEKSAYKPVILILQPMKNADKVRKYLRKIGYGLDRDFTFYQDDKYYDIMRAKFGFNDFYNEKEEQYGRENLKGNPDFIRFLNERILEVENILSTNNLSPVSKNQLIERLQTFRGLKDEIERNLRTD